MDPISGISALGGATSFAGWITALVGAERLEEILRRQEVISERIERLSERLLYASTMEQVKDLSSSQQKMLRDLQTLRQLLEPIQHKMQRELLVTVTIQTPSKLQIALRENPWEILYDIRPVGRLKETSEADSIPLLFMEGETLYLGHQKQHVLNLLDCSYEPVLTHNYYGQPDLYQSTLGRFTIPGDGSTIIDTQTGLMWAQPSSKKNVDWFEAGSYCKQLKLAGFTDWRLPSIEELETLYYPQREKRNKIFPLFQISGCLHSSTKDGSSKAFYFNFSAGKRASLPLRRANDRGLLSGFSRLLMGLQVMPVRFAK